MCRDACPTSKAVSIIGRSPIHHLTAHKATPNREIVGLSQDLIRELQNHLRDILDLTSIHFKAGDHDGSANLRSNAIITMIGLLEIHRTLARCEVASTAVRQHSRSKCGELLSCIVLTAQKVVVADGKYLSNLIAVRINGLPDCIMLTLARVVTVRYDRRHKHPRHHRHRFAFNRHFTPLHRWVRGGAHAHPFPDHIQRLLRPL